LNFKARIPYYLQQTGNNAGIGAPSGALYPKDFTMSDTQDTQQRIDQIVKSSDVVLFMKGTAQFPMCGFSGRAIQVLKACGVTKPATFNVLEDEEIRHGIKEYSNWPTIPQLYVKGEFVGGSDIMMEMYENGELQQVLGTPAA
jgi:monothiol glutaredoxin